MEKNNKFEFDSDKCILCQKDVILCDCKESKEKFQDHFKNLLKELDTKQMKSKIIIYNKKEDECSGNDNFNMEDQIHNKLLNEDILVEDIVENDGDCLSKKSDDYIPIEDKYSRTKLFFIGAFIILLFVISTISQYDSISNLKRKMHKRK